jgi:hypothetical protein
LSISATPSKLAVAFAATVALSPFEKSPMMIAGSRQLKKAKSVNCLDVYLNDAADSDVI